MVLRLNLAEAVVAVSGPGRSAAKRRISAILLVIASSCSRKAAGARTRIDFRVSIAWLRALTAVSRASDLEVTDHLDRAGRRFRHSLGLATEHSTGGVLGIQWIALAVPMPRLAIGTVHLKDGVTACLQGAREAGTVAAGTFDAERPDRAE
jgi:hypothetical protein